MGSDHLRTTEQAQSAPATAPPAPARVAGPSNAAVAQGLEVEGVSDTPVLDMAASQAAGSADPKDGAPEWAVGSGSVVRKTTTSNEGGEQSVTDAVSVGGGKASYSHTTAEKSADGSTGSSQSTSYAADLKKGTVGRTQTESGTDATGTRQSSSSGTALDLDDQALVRSAGTRTENKSGDLQSSSSTRTIGVDGISGSEKRESRDGHRYASREASGSAGRQGFSGSGKGRRGLTTAGDLERVTLYGEGGGGLTLDMRLVAQEDGQYAAVTTAALYVGLGMGGEIEGMGDAKGGKATLAVSGKASDTLVFTHVLAPDEVNRHVDMVQSGEASFVSLLLAGLGPNASAAGGAPYLGLEPGESVERMRSVEASGALGAKYKKEGSFAASITGSGSVSASMRATPDGVVATAMAGAETKVAVDGSLRVSAVNLGGGYAAGEADYVRLESRPLDPSSAKGQLVLETLWDASSREDVEMLWKFWGGSVFQHVVGGGSESSIEGRAGIVATLGISDSSSLSTEVGTGVQGLTADVEASHRRAVEGGVFGRDAEISGVTNTLEGQAADGEVSLTFSSATRVPAVRTSMGAVIPTSLDTLARFSLSDGEIERVLGLAGRKEEWEACARTVASARRWLTRARALSPLRFPTAGSRLQAYASRARWRGFSRSPAS